MVHGAVSKLLGIMNEERWYPYPKSENFYNPWHRDYSNKKPKWYDKSLEEPFYDEEGAKAGMEEDAAEAYKAMQSVLFRKAVAIDKWGKKKDVQPKYVDKAFRKAQFQTWNGDLTLAWKYLEARAKKRSWIILGLIFSRSLKRCITRSLICTRAIMIER